MVRWLARSPDVVVTRCTAIRGRGNVVEAPPCERRNRVAAVTTLRGLDVGDGLGQCPPLSVLDMATHTVTGRALEDAFDVAGFATHLLVRTRQRKTCRHVVKRRCRPLRANA